MLNIFAEAAGIIVLRLAIRVILTVPGALVLYVLNLRKRTPKPLHFFYEKMPILSAVCAVMMYATLFLLISLSN